MRQIYFLWLATVVPVLAQDSEADIRGPKPLIELPVDPEPTPWLQYSLIGAAAFLLVGMLIWWLTRKKLVVFSAEQKAVRELQKLEGRGADLEAGDFALEASGIVRVFIERKYSLAAPKRTTEEFLQEVVSEGGESLRSKVEPLRSFLKACDMAKFAGENLGEYEREALVTKAKDFVETPVVEQTKKEEVT